MANRKTKRGSGAAIARRDLLQGAMGITALIGVSDIAVATAPEKLRPQAGDVLAHRFGDRKGEPVTPEQVPGGAELLQVVARDPVTGTLRDGSRLNGINVVRLDPADFDEETLPMALPEGIIAYSSVCTHQGCDLTQWLPESRTFKCYCHYSEFHAGQMGQPMHGPAKRRLAVLPLKLEQGHIVVNGPFVGKVGFKKKQF